MIDLQLLGIYPSWLSWTFAMILNVSVSLALYSLVVFYHVFAKELAPHKPLAKFLCVKGIVVFCFWQGILLDILVAMGIVKSNHFWLDGFLLTLDAICIHCCTLPQCFSFRHQ